MTEPALYQAPFALSGKLKSEADRVRLLYRLSPPGFAISVLISFLTVAALWKYTSETALLQWLTASLVVTAGRGALYVFYMREGARADMQPRQWESAFIFAAGMMGLVWTWLVFLGPLPIAFEIFVAFVVGGMAMGAAGILGASRPAFIVFAAPMVFAQIAELLWMGGTLYTYMGAMGAIFAFGLDRVYSQFRATLMEAFESRGEIEKLHQRQRLIFNTATVGIVFIQDDGVVDCNQNFADIFGYSREELVGFSTRIYFVNEESWMDISKRILSVGREGKAFRGEVTLKRKDGQRILCNMNADSLVPAHPEFGIVAIVNDISARKRAEHELRVALQEQLAIFDNAVVGILYVSNWKIVNCNSRLAKLFGFARDELIGQSTRIFHVSDENWEESGKTTNSAISSGESYSFEEQFVKKSGEHFWCRGYARAIDPRHPDTAVFVLQDITEQKRAEEELLENRDRLELIVRAAQSGMWDHDLIRNQSVLSPRFMEILGFPADSDPLDIGHFSDRLHSDDRERIQAAVESHLSQHTPFDHEYRLRRADGSYVWVQGHGQAIWDKAGVPFRFVGSIVDITERKQHEAQIRNLAQHDVLTGLPNRRLLDDRLKQSAAQARRSNELLAAMVVDLDGFKSINDNHGHKAGDEVLLQIAKRLSNSVREVDTVARFGGDEFVILLPGQRSWDNADKLARKILAAVSEPIVIGGQEHRVSASIGVAFYPTDADDIDWLIQRADNAMYRVKNTGRNGVAFFAETKPSAGASNTAH